MGGWLGWLSLRLGEARRRGRLRSLRGVGGWEEVRFEQVWLFLGLGVLVVLGSVVVVLGVGLAGEVGC